MNIPVLSVPAAWSVLVVAGLFEIGWAVGLRYTQGFTRPLATILTIIAIVLSMGLLGVAVRTLPLGTAYAVWTGIGTIGTALFGIFVLHEPATAVRLVFLSMIVCGIVGLKFFAK
jgi:quaternary ammonium compound-resistance protein SugE